ncbi:hypothetical protein BD410DRAFT_342236 [Rickenella mellea]|uniref:DUF6533 domain-containing protein n=1 Tax=Rickenella mellea TaxID=50990 RepID=A0A4Y7QMJ2_9AGAM|nr:hypothetical protein BD410DRAFT_342236 [Rickenella mellea]
MAIADLTSNTSTVEILADIYANYQVSKYITMVSFSILIWDYLITLESEIKLIWPARGSSSKVLFLINRYFAFFEPVLLMLVTITFHEPERYFCTRGLQVSTLLSAFGFMIAQVILKMRTWAIWERKRWVTVLLVSEFFIAVGIEVFVLERYVTGIHYVPVFAVAGCSFTFSNRLIFINFILIMVSETIMVILLIIKAFQHFRVHRATLMVAMYQDGLFHYSLILATSIANVFLMLLAPVRNYLKSCTSRFTSSYRSRFTSHSLAFNEQCTAFCATDSFCESEKHVCLPPSVSSTVNSVIHRQRTTLSAAISRGYLRVRLRCTN